MTWTRLDDTWTDKPQLEELDFATRWHYLAMIQFCSRNERHDGLVRNIDARRCSDVPDPARCLAELATANLIRVEGGAYRILGIAEHVPPEWVAKKRERDRDRKRRERAHKAGDHSLCAETCVPANVTSTVTANVTANAGTGRDGTGRADTTGGSTETIEWETAVPGRPDLKVVSG